MMEGGGKGGARKRARYLRGIGSELFDTSRRTRRTLKGKGKEKGSKERKGVTTGID